MKVRIVEPGWEGYNGPVAGIQFEAGVSEDVTARQALQIAAILRAEGTEGENIVALANDEMSRVIEAPIEEVLRSQEAPKTDENEVPMVPAGLYTREDLEAVADEKGIAGIRDIAEPMGIKGTSIAKLIEAILDYKG